MKKAIYFADITHTAQGVSAATFPLGVSFVLSYAKHLFDPEFNFKLFKFPAHLDQALRTDPPAMPSSASRATRSRSISSRCASAWRTG